MILQHLLNSLIQSTHKNMKYISAINNPSVKEVKSLETKKSRDKSGLFVVEGFRVICELLEGIKSGCQPVGRVREVFIRESFPEESRDKADMLCRETDTRITCVADRIFDKMCDTENPQGILAVVHKDNEHILFQDLLTTGKTVLVLENVSDPGNLGTVIRTADAVGAGGIILAGNCVDQYSPKVVRSTMGSIFRVPVIRVSGSGYCEKTEESLRSYNYRIAAAHLQGSSDCFKTDLTGAVAFLLGNEANGLTDAMTDIADVRIRIPIIGQAESLNLGIAAGVLLYEAYRQGASS